MWECVFCYSDPWDSGEHQHAKDTEGVLPGLCQRSSRVYQQLPHFTDSRPQGKHWYFSYLTFWRFFNINFLFMNFGFTKFKPFMFSWCSFFPTSHSLMIRFIHDIFHTCECTSLTTDNFTTSTDYDRCCRQPWRRTEIWVFLGTLDTGGG